MNSWNIGIFDSGIGGLNVASNILMSRPHENIIYFADSVNMPYGDKTDSFIKSRVIEIIQFLNQQNCNLILIACNTASAIWIRYLCNVDYFSNIKILNVIDPTVDYLIKYHHDQKVGLIATLSTINSNIYSYKLLYSNIDLILKPIKLLASMIEEFGNRITVEQILSTHIMDDNFKDIDSLILGCTHYSFIKNQIMSIFKNKIKIIDTSEILALAAIGYLEQNRLLSTRSSLTNKNGNILLYTNNKSFTIEKIKNEFFQKTLKIIQI